MKKGGLWQTRFGFYLAAVGSAFGLGNIWRFPYVVAENGGGAFVLLYMFLVFSVGMPFLIGELLLGKVTGSAVLPAMEHLREDRSHLVGKRSSPTSWAWDFLTRFGGRLSICICLLVLAYYAVISGWVLHFLMQFLIGTIRPQGINADSALAALMNNGWLQMLLASVHILIVMVAVAQDVEEGIEKWIGQMMPLFIVLLVILATKAMTMENSTEALRFFLYPDFSRLSFRSLGQAMGHVFFTLSIGFGTMVTFGSYLRDRANIPLAGFRVAVFDSLISLFAGIMIFPLVVGSASEVRGPQLLFKTVPAMLSHLPNGHLFGIGFFLCLYLAALGASIGLLETAVANLREAKRMPRGRATLWTAGVCMLFAVVPAMSSSSLSDIRLGGRGMLEFLDAKMINWMLPVAALIISQVVTYRIDQALQKAEFPDDQSASLSKLYSHWRFTMRFLAPALILIALILQVLDPRS